MNRRIPVLPVLLLLIGLTAVLPGAATAQVAKEGHSSLDGLVFTSPRLSASESLEAVDDVQGILQPDVANAWASFRRNNGEWNALVDKRSGRVGIAEGNGIPWIPGRGNPLIGASTVSVASLDAIARGFMPRVAAVLGINPNNLVLNRGRSGMPADYLAFVDYDVVLNDGSLVEGARVVFRVNHGNLIQFGTENLPPLGNASGRVTVNRADALGAVARYIGGFTAADSFIDSGSTHVLPLAKIDNRFGEGFEFGKGRVVVPVWQFTFHRDGVMGTWRARVDGGTNEVLELADVNEYATAQATGGVYMSSPTVGAEVVRPMPFTNISSGGFTNSAGNYNFTSAVTSSLAGQYVRITDTCGTISQASDGAGAIAFGTSAGTDCTTPGHGGNGNTHSSRTQFYQVNRIKEVARGWLPTNTWLNAQLTVNVNLNQTCNAYWNGSTLNFFKSGGGCANTGQLAAVSLHEFGHGMDQNDGTGTAPEGGTGEAYGDITATIALHDSCIGPGFLGSNCAGYGNACTSCTGVRDIDFAKHSSPTAATVANHTQVRCGAGSGPCGKEVHCESYVPSEAVWDFANRDLPNPGSGTAWSILDRLWYLSRNTATSSFTCTTGGTFTSNGCGTGNWWKTMRAVDDDDGNLANGTPHGGALFAAFNRHGIACTTDPGASTTFAGCTPPSTPSLSLTAGDNSAALSWGSSGGGVVYDVYRNETSCNAGFIKVANDVSTTSFTDNSVANGLTYFYQIVAHPSGTEACGGTPSTCQSVTPTGGGGTPDFTISASPSSVSIAQGAAGSSTITTTVSGGFNSAIALSATGQPSGVTVSFSPSSIAAPGSGSSTMNITVGASTAVGTSTITVTGTGGSITHTTTVSLTVTSAGGGVTALTNGVPVTGLSGATGSQQFFSLAVPAGATNLVFQISGGTGDADLYVRFGSQPTTSTWDCRPFLNGNNETCTFAAPQTGTYFVLLQGFAAYSGVSLVGSYTTSTPNFTISASPTSTTIAQGGSGNVTISTAVSGGFNSAIALSATGQPSGVTVGFSPTSIPAPGSGSSTMTITVGAATATGTYTITVSGTGGSLTRTTPVTLTVTGSAPQQLLGNPGFENGSANPAPWVPTAGVIDSSASQAPHGGTWKAWLNGYGTTHTDTLYQQVTIPASATTATLTFWLHIDSAETTTTTAFDTLNVQIRNTSNAVLSTLATYSNLNKATGYTQKSFNVVAFKGQTIRVYFLGAEDSSLQTSFVVDDTALNVQ